MEVTQRAVLSEQEECWGSSRTLRGTEAVKECTGRSSTQECSATSEKSFSVNNVSAEEHTHCRKGCHDDQKRMTRACLTARHKYALQGRDGEGSHRSREAGER